MHVSKNTLTATLLEKGNRKNSRFIFQGGCCFNSVLCWDWVKRKDWKKNTSSIHIFTSSKALWLECPTWDWEVVPCRVIIKTVKNGSQCLPAWQSASVVLGATYPGRCTYTSRSRIGKLALGPPQGYLLFYSHLQLQVKPNLKHLHLPRHSDLQPHVASCSQLCAIGAFAVQKTPHCSPSFFHPQSAGLSASGWHWVAWPHMQPAWYAACLVCWSRAALVGGMASYGLCFRANMSSLASSTLTAVLDRSYSRTTNFSRISRSLSVRTGGYWLSLLKMREASGKMSQVCQAPQS